MIRSLNFRLILGSPGPTTGLGNPGHGSGLKHNTGCATSQPQRPKLRPNSGHLVISGVGRNKTNKKINLRSPLLKSAQGHTSFRMGRVSKQAPGPLQNERLCGDTPGHRPSGVGQHLGYWSVHIRFWAKTADNRSRKPRNTTNPDHQ